MWKVKRMKPARIVVLVIALAAGGIAALLAGRSEAAGAGARHRSPSSKPSTSWSPTTISAWADRIGEQDLRWQTWPAAAAGPNFIRKSDRPDAIKHLAGSIDARRRSRPASRSAKSKLIKANGSGYMAAILPAGMRAVSTEISPETGAGGFILPNDHVDVILSRRDKEAEKSTGVEIHTSETILSNVRVLAIDQTVEEKNGQRVVVGKTATLELTPHQAETLALSRQLGTLSLALRSLVDFNDKGKPDPADSGRRAASTWCASASPP